MANNVYAANIIAGGGAGSLDDISDSILSDDDVAFVIVATTGLLYFYYYDSASGETDDGVDFVTPTSASGDERWVLTHCQSFTDFFRDAAKATDLDEFYTGLGLKYDHMWLGAGAFTRSSTNGAVFGTEELANNDINLSYYSFDAATTEYIEFDLVMPSTWDRSTVKAKFYWMPTSGATAAQVCRWGIQGGSYTDAEEMDAALGTAVEVNDAAGTGLDGQLHISAATGAVTIAGSAALGHMIHLKVYREGADAGDTMVGDAKLIGIVLQFGNTNEVAAWA